MAYATVDDLHAYLGSTPPADSQRLLARASELVDRELLKVVFTTDSGGNATDAGVIAAINRATCRQVEFWIANGDELNELGNWTSYNVAGISVSRDAAAASSRRRSRLCARAKDEFFKTVTSLGFFPVPMLPSKPTI